MVALQARGIGELALAIAAGVVLALPFVKYAGRRAFAIGLVVATVVYLDLVGIAIFGVIAYVGARRAPWILALGWVVHMGWDLLRHPQVPWWYPAVCIGFDLVVAAAILRSGRVV